MCCGEVWGRQPGKKAGTGVRGARACAAAPTRVYTLLALGPQVGPGSLAPADTFHTPVPQRSQEATVPLNALQRCTTVKYTCTNHHHDQRRRKKRKDKKKNTNLHRSTILQLVYVCSPEQCFWHPPVPCQWLLATRQLSGERHITVLPIFFTCVWFLPVLSCNAKPHTASSSLWPCDVSAGWCHLLLWVIVR